MDEDATTCLLAIEPTSEDPFAATDDPLAPLDTLLLTELAACLLPDGE
jgi:hypothetical protein